MFFPQGEHWYGRLGPCSPLRLPLAGTKLGWGAVWSVSQGNKGDSLKLEMCYKATYHLHHCLCWLGFHAQGLREVLYSALSSSCLGAYFGGNVFTETKDLSVKVDMGLFLTCIGQIRFNPVIPHLHVYFILVIQTFYLSDNSWLKQSFELYFYRFLV